MIIVVAKIRFNSPADRDRAVALSEPIQRATREQEPGCHDYCFAPDPCEPTIIQVYELWEDEASLAAHFKHQNYLNMRDALGEIGLAGADNDKYRCDLKEPVYDETMTPRADFFTA